MGPTRKILDLIVLDVQSEPKEAPQRKMVETSPFRPLPHLPSERGSLFGGITVKPKWIQYIFRNLTIRTQKKSLISQPLWTKFLTWRRFA